ncbi:MAG: homocysteine S-methyltransferase family protein [Kiritimatiellae bacterium]|nr:homocysteine S-methyltransferase family protein [Kiritimatiellia bacterium]
MNFKEFLGSANIIFADGAMGTSLQKAGLKPGEVPETWSIKKPEVIRAIHAAYFAAGSDFVLANTFGANRVKYDGGERLEDVISASITLAREAANGAKNKFVAIDVGPTGKLLKPSGDFEFDRAYDAFAETISLGAASGADLVAIETMGDAYELKAAVLAAKENSTLPILATVALGEDGKLLTGADIETVATILEGLRVDAIGLNCGLGPDLMLPYVERLAAATNVPIFVKPNAGLPKLVDGETRFLVSSDEFAKNVVKLVHAGARIVGGCCGTTSAHIAAVKAALESESIAKRAIVKKRAIVTSGVRSVEIPFNDSIIIGERINPTGKKKLREAYKAGDMAYILREAVAQVDAGSHILDVNAGVPGIDEASTLEATIEAIQSVVNVPLQIDTADPIAMERAMRRYNGKCLVNSVNGKAEVMEKVFPLVAKYGGVVVALTLDENGIPSTAEGRVEIARKIIAKGAEYGLTKDDFIVDVLCLAVSADNTSANVILEAMKSVRELLGVRTALGVSNISFGLPSRTSLNAAFYTLTLNAGLSAAIINPLSLPMISAYRAYRALTGRDSDCSKWIAFSENLEGGETSSTPATSQAMSLSILIEKGLRDDASEAARCLVSTGLSPLEIINSEIVPALEKVGSLFESGKYFLPQLLMAADTASAAFEYLRSELAKSGVKGATKGPIVIATVKGDIHDIGKNIVRSLLENYGFEVIDLGRDVSPDVIVETVLKTRCRLVGLSALMTTTVGAMAETIAALKLADSEVKTFVGGAVLTEEFAKEIGATWYAKDAMASVRIAEAFFTNKV